MTLKKITPLLSAALSLAALSVAALFLGSTQNTKATGVLADSKGAPSSTDATNRMCTEQKSGDDIYFISCGGIY